MEKDDWENYKRSDIITPYAGMEHDWERNDLSDMKGFNYYIDFSVKNTVILESVCFFITTQNVQMRYFISYNFNLIQSGEAISFPFDHKQQIVEINPTKLEPGREYRFEYNITGPNNIRSSTFLTFEPKVISSKQKLTKFEIEYSYSNISRLSFKC